MRDTAIRLNVTSSCKRLGESVWLTAQSAPAAFSKDYTVTYILIYAADKSIRAHHT